MGTLEEQQARIDAILGDSRNLSFEESVDKYYNYLCGALQLPCEVTGIEDFNWEERYVFGAGTPKEYAQLQKSQPSYQDRYELLDIEKDVVSPWMLFRGDDLAAHVRRKSDRKEFCLGLAELKAVDKSSKNYELLNDFSVWLVNNR